MPAKPKQKISDEISELQKKIDIFKSKIKEKINNLPDNPKIKRLGPNCFTISSKDLEIINWTPEYYDFKRHYSILLKMIDKNSIEKIDSLLKEIISSNRPVNINGTWVSFHPELRKELAKIY